MDKEQYKVIHCPVTGLSGVLNIEEAKNVLSNWIEDAHAVFYGEVPEEEIREALRRLIKELGRGTKVAVKGLEVKLLEPCCEELKMKIEEEPARCDGLGAFFDEEKKTIGWEVIAESAAVFHISFCPFCGARLPDRAESIEGLEEKKSGTISG